MTDVSWRTGSPPEEVSVQGDRSALAGKVALIAGETRSIGLGVARSLARRGALRRSDLGRVAAVSASSAAASQPDMRSLAPAPRRGDHL